MPFRIGVLCLAIAFLLPSPASGKDLAKRKWIEVSTANFRVQSTLGEERTVEFLRYLELMRATVPYVTNIESTGSSIPTHVYALSGRGDLSKFGMGFGVGGVFLRGLRNNTILLRNVVGNVDESHIMLHEYVHYLTRNAGGHDYPRWFTEGIAEYLAGARIEDGFFFVGVPRRFTSALRSRDWLSPKQMLESSEYVRLSGPQVNFFYEQSWLLVQYLLSTSDDFAADMHTYLGLRSEGAREIDAFEQAFGVQAKRLNREMRDYLFGGCCKVYRFDIERLQPDFETTVRVPASSEVALGLAQAALQFGRDKQSRRWFEMAAEEEGTRAQAETGLGDLLKFENQFEEAEPYFDRALALAPDDPYVQLDVAEFWLSRYLDSEPSEEREEYLKLARTHFVASWKLDDSIPETYVMYGRSFLAGGDDYEKAAQMLEEGLYRLPNHAETRAWLAEAYARGGRLAEAIATANSIRNLGHGNSEFALEALTLVEAIVEEGAQVADSPTP